MFQGDRTNVIEPTWSIKFNELNEFKNVILFT